MDFRTALAKSKNGTKADHVLAIEMNDGDHVKPLAQFMREVKRRADVGHSFSLEDDREEGGDKRNYPRTGIDGDGADRILRVTLDGDEVDPVSKDDPGVGDVHVSSAGGAGGTKRPKRKYKPAVMAKMIDVAGLSEAAAEWIASNVDEGSIRKADLQPHDANTAKTPFQYDQHALGDLRPDQVPRFFGALTDPDTLEETEVPLAGLYAMQNRIDPAKVDSIRASGGVADLPTVVRYNGKNYIADGHHRLAAAWLDGAETAKVRMKNIGPRSNALKGMTLRVPISKIEPDQNRIFGYASVCEKDGKPFVDVQDDWTSEADLEEAFYDFVKNARNVGEMHADYGKHLGECIECMVFTKAKQQVLGIVLKDKDGHQIVPAWVGFEVTPELFAKVKDGTFPGFSIGGSGVRLEKRT